MKKLVVDNKHLNNLANWANDFVSSFQKEIILLKDEKGDIFNRYMAYHRCELLFQIMKPLRNIAITSMRLLVIFYKTKCFILKHIKRTGGMNVI